MREAAIERFLVSGVKAAGGWAPKLTSPGTAGMPDRLVLMPGGRLWFVELKAPGEQPRPLQRIRHEALRAMGFEVRVLDSKERVKEFCDEIARVSAFCR